MVRELRLSPAQKTAFEGLLDGLQHGAVLALKGGSGMGKTTILEKIQASAGGDFLSVRHLMGALMA